MNMHAKANCIAKFKLILVYIKLILFGQYVCILPFGFQLDSRDLVNFLDPSK